MRNRTPQIIDDRWKKKKPLILDNAYGINSINNKLKPSAVIECGHEGLEQALRQICGMPSSINKFSQSDSQPQIIKYTKNKIIQF